VITFTRVGDDPVRLVVDDARPIERITDEMLAMVKAGQCEPWLRLDPDRLLLRVEGVNGRWVYRLVGHDVDARLWWLEWV
jgi:hypothetical protein